MALDLQEQEELENAKRAWKLWGRWVFAVMLGCAVLYLGNILWKNHVAAQNAEAFTLSQETFVPSLDKKDQANVLSALKTLQQRYPKTVATAQATLLAAGSAFDGKRYDEAVGHLKWLLEQQNNPAVRAIALQRLATIYLQQKKYDDALRVANEKTEPEFAARMETLKGDIYQAQGKAAEAKTAYAAALKQLPENDPSREWIEAQSR